MMKIAIGIPALNEEKNIGSIIVKLKNLSYVPIVCNDGSSDETEEIAKQLGAIVVNHSKNLGYGAAIKSLIKKAKELEFDFLVTFDADGQHEISDIKKVLKPVLEKEADISIGSRFSGKESDIPKYRKLGIQTITKITNSITSNKVKDSQSGFRAYNKKTLQEISPVENGMGVSTEILIKADSKNFKIVEVPIIVSYKGDTSKLNPASHGASVIMSTLKFISIENPLKFYGIPGIIFLIVGLFFIVWTIQGFTETRQVITNISLIGIGSTIFGGIFLMTAIILYSLVNVVRER